MKAWLLTWEGTKEPATSQERKILAILSSRLGTNSIEHIVEVLYTRCVWGASESVTYANKRKLRQERFRHVYSQPSRFFYGNNPCIFARIVEDIRVNEDPDRNRETISWVEGPYVSVESQGEMPVEVEPAIEKTIIRMLEPLSPEIYAKDA